MSGELLIWRRTRKKLKYKFDLIKCAQAGVTQYNQTGN